LAIMDTYSPAIFFTIPAGTLRPALVYNSDGSVNSPSNPAARGSKITIYATGQGFVPGAPPDGTPAPSNPPLSTPFTPRVNINGLFTDQYTPTPSLDPPDRTKFVLFSGLAPGLVGIWQIDVQIPGAVSPGNQIPLFIEAGSLPSIEAGTFLTTIAVSAK